MALAPSFASEILKPDSLPFKYPEGPNEEQLFPAHLSAAPLPPGPLRLYLNGVPVDRISIECATAWVIHALKFRNSAEPLLIMGPNAQLVALAARDPRFSAALRSSNLAIPDGISVVIAAKLLNRPVPERVPGGELMERLCIEAARNNLSVFFLGGLPGAAQETARKFERLYSGFRVAGTCCPPLGFELDPVECERVRQHIAEARPDLLCVALGAPKQEIWMCENCPTLPIGAAIAVGAALDTQAGLRKRAPKWPQKLGLEWLYRLAREPRRLWRRYLFGNSEFIWLVARQLWRESKTGSPTISLSSSRQ